MRNCAYVNLRPHPHKGACLGVHPDDSERHDCDRVPIAPDWDVFVLFHNQSEEILCC